MYEGASRGQRNHGNAEISSPVKCPAQRPPRSGTRTNVRRTGAFVPPVDAAAVNKFGGDADYLREGLKTSQVHGLDESRVGRVVHVVEGELAQGCGQVAGLLQGIAEGARVGARVGCGERRGEDIDAAISLGGNLVWIHPVSLAVALNELLVARRWVAE